MISTRWSSNQGLETFLVAIGAHMIILLIVKVKVLCPLNGHTRLPIYVDD